MLGKILLFVVGLPVAIAVLLTFVGVMLALFGGMFGWEYGRVLGGSLAQLGLLGIVAVFFLAMMGDVTGGLALMDRKKEAEPDSQAKADEQKGRVE